MRRDACNADRGPLAPRAGILLQTENSERSTSNGWDGTRTPAETTENNACSPENGAESGALHAESGDFNSDLAQLVAAWPSLPRFIKAAILNLLPDSLGNLGKVEPHVLDVDENRNRA